MVNILCRCVVCRRLVMCLLVTMPTQLQASYYKFVSRAARRMSHRCTSCKFYCLLFVGFTVYFISVIWQLFTLIRF